MSALTRLLARRPAQRIRWGLERTEAMLGSLGHPHRAVECLHVAGTNGKGSTAALAEAVLRQSGRRTGLYTSPHLSDFSERIRIQGAPAEEGLLESCSEAVLPLAEREDASFFESATVLAFEAFRRAGCDTVVAEVGLGGRLDATNVVAPRVTAITSVDLDHADYLGDTLREIAAEKAGILKAGVPVVTGALAPGPLDVISGRARALGAPHDAWGRQFRAEDVRFDSSGTMFVYTSSGWADGLYLHTRLIGSHQAVNAAVAVRSIECSDWGAEPADVVEGLSGATWPGRLEVTSGPAGSWVFDIAHNPAAIRALTGALCRLQLPEPRVFVVAILGDKPWADMLHPLAEGGARVILTVAPSSPEERRWSLSEALAVCREGTAEGIEDFGQALRRARELAAAGTVIVTGSAHTVGDARTLLTTR